MVIKEPERGSIEKVHIDLQNVPPEKRYSEYLKMVKANRAAAAERRARRAPKAMKRREIMFKLKEKRRQAERKLKKERFEAKQKKEITRPLASLEVGMEVDGVVQNVEMFGCFVDIGAERDGLLHIREMDTAGWVVRAGDAVDPGQRLEGLRVKYVDAAADNPKLQLSLRGAQGRPDVDLDKDPLSEFEEGDELWGVVTKVTNFGAFVDCGAVVDGFLHLKDYPDRVMGRPATESFYNGMRLRVYVKEVELDKNRLKITHIRPEWLPTVW